jgi:hypothetical protein
VTRASTPRGPRRHHPPAARLLLVPLLLVVVVLAGLELLARTAPHDPPTRDQDLTPLLAPVAVPDDPGCTRAGHDPDDDVPARMASSVGPDQRVASATVRSCPLAFDGLQLRYAGELVGDLLRREGGAWVLVNDDAYALEVGPLTTHRDGRGTNSGLTVWLPDDLVELVTGLGRPGHRGDVVELTGTVVRTDPTDGGGLTLRATAMDVLAPAVPVTEPLHVPQLVAALALCLLALVLGVARRRAEARPHPRHRPHRGDP